MIEPPVSSSLDPSGAGSLLGFETTSLSAEDVSSNLGGGIELEPTSLVEEPAAVSDAGITGSLDFVMPDEVQEAAVEIPLIEDDLVMPEASETLSAEAAAVSEIPLIDASPEAIARVSIPPLPMNARPSTLMAVKSVEMLQAVVEGDPEDWGSHRELAEAMLEAGNREGGLRELETAMSGYERSGDLATAMSVADEIVRLEPSSVKHHQKRVEYAYRSNDRPQLVEAYLALADALFRSGQVDKSRTIYQRVLELSPDDVRAQAALSTMPDAVPEAARAKTPAGGTRAAPPTPPPAPKMDRKLTPTSDDAFVNLGDWLRDDEGPKDTRMVVAEEEPTGNEEADFADMLKKFKQGVAENVEAEDYQAHYDLGVAYKEMGLVDEAIAEFQVAVRGPDNRVRTYEAIGQCFIEKGQNAMAATILARALNEKGHTDDSLVGVLYLLGRANEALGKIDEAMKYYQRVFVVDITFHDVGDRLNALENAAR
jgi:tetratricopeptide (TPR) repeat protein